MSFVSREKNNFIVEEDLGWHRTANSVHHQVVVRCRLCDRKKEIAYAYLMTGNARCICQYKSRSKPFGVASRNALMHQYKANAKASNLIFELSPEQFSNLTSGNCTYCGTEPSSSYYRSSTHYGPYLCNGIDRQNNSLGYTVENSVTCCTWCNMIKRQHSVDQLFSHIEKMYFYMSSSK